MALAFTDLRTNRREGPPGYTAVALQGANLRTQARQLARKYSDIVIDVGGRDNRQPTSGPYGGGGGSYPGKASKL